MDNFPLIAPLPPRLSGMQDALRAIEDRGVYSNGGPVVRRFEDAARDHFFGGEGACLAVANATLGLMLACRQAREGRAGRYALVPAFTFAATAHAAIWAGLTPILVDSDPLDWAASGAAEQAALARYGDEIAVALPYDTFGAAIDLARYDALARAHGIGVVVDAAASLGTLDGQARGFGTGSRFACVYSMHATKTFATAEGGLIHSADAALVDTLRAMHNFGFGAPRTATAPGLNAKLPEVLGLLALAKLAEIEDVADRRAALAARYRRRLDGFGMQASSASRQAAQFMPVLLPRGTDRAAVIRELAARGIGSGQYFAPHLGQQPYFRRECIVEPTPVADDIAARILSLPITDAMSVADVDTVCAALHAACRAPVVAVPAAPEVCSTVVVGGGPAAIATLIAAGKSGKLAGLARGLVVVERGAALGAGELPSYAITSDSTAETFLSAVRNDGDPDIAALVDHPGGVEIARWVGALGVPLARTRPFLEAMGERVGTVVTANGGTILTGHEVLEARRTASGEWRTRVRDTAGHGRDLLSHNLILAIGGYQSPTEVAAARVAGQPLGERVGERLLPSDALLRIGGIDRLRERLADVRAPRIAIVGASTSALAAATLLLKSSLPLGANAVTLLSREQLRPFYASVEAAQADGFTDFDADDICPVSGFVYRLAGFRLEARELVLRMLGIGGRVPDPRLRLHRIAGDADPAAARILDEADIVVGALGYRPRVLPLFDAAGDRIALNAHAPGRPRLVDQQCRVIDAHGRPLPNVYGIGLAAGFVPEGRLGGERSFRGKANGLWLWQNDIGRMIVDQLTEERRSAAA